MYMERISNYFKKGREIGKERAGGEKERGA
jgi:hypothetical protein